MASDLQTVLRLEVPIIVELGRLEMRLGDVMSLAPGAIIDLHKPVADELELRVNNKPIGSGVAVKVDENFGLRVTSVGGVRSRIEALGGEPASPPESDPAPEQSEEDTEAPAAQSPAGQG